MYKSMYSFILKHNLCIQTYVLTHKLAFLKARWDSSNADTHVIDRITTQDEWLGRGLLNTSC